MNKNVIVFAFTAATATATTINLEDEFRSCILSRALPTSWFKTHAA
jgi:hypothetical protein